LYYSLLVGDGRVVNPEGVVMKIAITRWGFRVAPLFDEARGFYIIEVVENELKSGRKMEMDGSTSSRAALLHETGVEILICGGISEYYQRQLTALGIKVFHSVSGEIDAVIAQFLKGFLTGISGGRPAGTKKT
jgi:predicted Fe-Mo cluster-binding NifX family protein